MGIKEFFSRKKIDASFPGLNNSGFTGSKFAGGIPLFDEQTIIHQEGRDWKEVLTNVKVNL
jgi:hypothetical protein